MIDGENLENLWFNVIVQSFVDLMTKVETGEYAINKKNSIEWMTLDNEKFLVVCDLAGINTSAVVKAKNIIIKENKKRRIWRKK